MMDDWTPQQVGMLLLFVWVVGLGIGAYMEGW